MLHALAEESGEYGSFTTTSAGTTSTLVCSKFVNTNLAATEFANMYVLVETGACAGQVGHIRGGGLTRSTGTLTTADDFTSLIESGVTFSLYRLLPPVDGEGVLPSYLKIVNWSVKRIPTERTISFAGVTAQYYYTVSQVTYPWFTDTERIRWIEWPVTTVGDIPRRMRDEEWEWDSNGATKRLYFRSAPFQTGETFTVKVMAPGNSQLKRNASLRAVLTSTAISSVIVDAGGYYTALPTIAPVSGSATFTAVMTMTPGPITSVTVGAGGTYTASQPPALTVTRNAADTGWADVSTQTAGLVTVGDEALPDTDDVVTMGTALMFRALSRLQQPSAEIAEWLAKMQPSMRAAKLLQQDGIPEDRTASIVKLRPQRVAYRGQQRY